MSTKLGDITLTKKSGTTLTLNTKKKYVSDDVSFNISVVEGSVTQNAPTVNASGLVTATTSTTAGFVPTSATADSNTLQLSTQAGKTVTPTENEQTAVASGKYTTGAIKVGAISSTYVGSDIPQNDSEDLSISENTVTAPTGYYAEDASATVPVGTVTSGTATISSVTVADGSDASKFALSGSANVSAPTVGTAGYISSSKGTRNAKSGGATLSATVNKIVGSASISQTKKKPSISKQSTPSGVTNAASGNATTTVPSSGVYVAVKSAENVSTVTPTVSITTSGYGTSSKHGITASGANVGAAESDMTYIPITTTSASVSGKTVSYGSGWITEGSTSVADGSVTPAVNSHTITAPSVACKTTGTGASLGTTTKPSGTDGTDYWTFTPSADGTNGSSVTNAKATVVAGYIATSPSNSGNSTKDINTTINNGTTRYITKASTSTTNGTATATAGTASTSVTGMVTTSTNTGYSVSASATGGNASVTASSATVGVGYNPSSVTASTTANSATGESASQTKYIQKGVLSASVSSNSGGSASMAATGFTAASSATDYYVTLSTSAGSVKAKAAVGTEGYVKTETKETSATSVAVSGNGNKLYVPAGAYAGSVSSHSISTTPVVTGSISGTVTDIGTTTKPSGTDGTNYWTITPGGSVTTTGKSMAKGKATISTAGYIPTGNNESSASTINITPTVNNGTARYLAKATTSTSNGTASATANAGTASIAKQPSASASVTANGIDGGYYTDSTTSSYYIDCSASAASGYSTATGGSASASVTASSVTVGVGYNPSSVTASTNASSTGNKTGDSATSTEVTASQSKKIYLKPAGISGGGGALSNTTNYSGTPTISVALDSQTTSGIAITDTAQSSGYYIKLIGSTAKMTGSTTVTRAAYKDTRTAGYLPARAETTILGSTTCSPSVTVNAASKTRYLTIPTATFANSATSGTTYTDVSESGPVLVAGDYLYINKGWTPDCKISLAKLVPDGSDVKGHGEYIISGHSAYDNDGTLVAGTIPTLVSSDISVNGATVTIPVGKYTGASGATAVTKTVGSGAVSTTFTGDGMSTYFDSGTSSDKNVTITPKYTNTAGYVAAHSTATNNGGTTYYKIKTVSGSIGGTASGGSATAAISNVNSMNTISDVSGKTAGTDYWSVKATATGSAGSYTPKYTVSTAGWISSTVTGTAQSISVSSDTTGQSINIPKATFDKSGAKVYCKTAGYIPAGSSSSPVATIGNGTVVASVSSNSGGTASMAATGFTASGSETGYYVTLSTTDGSVKAKATGGTSGYITSSTTNETAATAVSVSGNNTKLYIPTGDYSATYQSTSNSLVTPSVSLSSAATTTYGFTKTTPSGTAGTNYLVIDPGATATAWSVTPKAIVSTEGYVASGNKTGTAVSDTPFVDTGTNYYVPVVTAGFNGGGISITNNYSKSDLAVTMADGNDKNVTNYTVGAKNTTTYPYYIKVSGSTPAVSGKTKATRAAASYTNNAGVIAAHNASQIWASSAVEPTVSVNAASGSTYVGLKAAVIAGSSTNATATTTVTPGTVSVAKMTTPSGVTNAASGNATTTAPTSGVYVAVKADVAANSTGTTSSITGSGNATVSTAGYAPTSLKGTVTVSGTATAKTSATSSTTTYVPIKTDTPTFKGGAVSGTATASSSTGASLSTSTNNSGITIAAAASATRAKVQYDNAVSGWVTKSASADAYAAGSATALTGTTYYLNGVTMSTPSSGNRTFTVTAPSGGVDHVYTFTQGEDGRTSIKVDNTLTMQWNAADESLDFIYT